MTALHSYLEQITASANSIGDLQYALPYADHIEIRGRIAKNHQLPRP